MRFVILFRFAFSMRFVLDTVDFHMSGHLNQCPLKDTKKLSALKRTQSESEIYPRKHNRILIDDTAVRYSHHTYQLCSKCEEFEKKKDKTLKFKNVYEYMYYYDELFGIWDVDRVMISSHKKALDLSEKTYATVVKTLLERIELVTDRLYYEAVLRCNGILISSFNERITEIEL